MNHGGKGANQAVAAARLGGDVTFICKIGNDIFGNETLEMFHKEKIDTTYVGITPQEPSGVALINVDKKGENCIVVASGANGTLSIDDIQHAEPAIKQASIVIMQLETPIESVTYAAKMAKKDGITVILNPAPAPTQQLPDDLLANVDILIPNVTEAEIISGMHITDDESAKEAIRYISSKGIKTVIITMGAKGALAYENNEFIHIPAFKVEAVDTTAAGDTFCGGLCVALSEGKNLKDAIIFASKASSISVTRMGAQVSIQCSIHGLLTSMLLIVFSLMSNDAIAQKAIRGTVLDEANEPIIGASVLVKGTTNGSITGVDGTFNVKANPSDVLVISYVGYATVEQQVGNQTQLVIHLREDSKVLNDVVVIGYGSTTKKELTGSVTSMKKDDLNPGTFTNAMGMLQGKVAGLQIINPNGADPTAKYEVLLRGTNTLSAGQGPLIIIDGVAGADIRNINFQEVESIDVLKDG